MKFNPPSLINLYFLNFFFCYKLIFISHVILSYLLSDLWFSNLYQYSIFIYSVDLFWFILSISPHLYFLLSLFKTILSFLSDPCLSILLASSILHFLLYLYHSYILSLYVLSSLSLKQLFLSSPIPGSFLNTLSFSP